MKYTKEMMQVHFTAWQQSGLTKLAYCQANSLSYQAFCKFCSRQNETTGFTLLKPAKQKQGKNIELHLVNGCYFSIPEDCSMSLLQKIMSLC
jgi:hypothetical protein